jgi:hypothetical protein
MKNVRRWIGALMVVVTLSCFMIGTAQAQTPGVIPDLNSWVGTWFKLTLTRTVYHFSNYGVKPTPSTPTAQAMGSAYMQVTGWNPSALPLGTMTASIYIKDHDTGQWIPTPFATLDIPYFAGSDLKFIGSTQIVTLGDVTLNFTFFFTGQKTGGKFVLGGVTNVKTLGGYMLEIDDVPGSTERWAGSVKISGPMVPESKVPPILVGP